METLYGIIGLLFSPFVGFAVWFVQSRVEAQRRVREQWNEHRRKVYLDILDPYIRLLASLKNKDDADVATKQIVSYEYKKASFELNIIADDEVVVAFNNMMQCAYRRQEGDATYNKRFMDAFGGLILAVRKSVGGSKTNLQIRDMLAGMLTDIDSYYPPK